MINGSHLDEASWDQVVKNLKASNYSVKTVSRWGHDPDKPLHFKQIAENACQKINNVSILVAHSFGGALANEMVGVCPMKISKIIYIAALVPLDGEHPADQLKGSDQKNYMSVVNVTSDRISPKSQVEFLMTMDADIKSEQTSLPKVFPEPLIIQGDVIEFSSAAFNLIPKYYIFTANDKIIPLEWQKKISQRIKLAGSDTIQTGHLPSISNPDKLAEILKSFIQNQK